MSDWNKNDDNNILLEKVNRQQDTQNESISSSDQSQVEDIEKIKGIDI